MQQLGVRFGLFLMAIFVSIGIFEAMLRVFTPEPENLAKLRASSLFLHENKPSSSYLHERLGEFENLISINSFGFRDSEFTQHKEPGVLRIAVLGDSQVEALQVPQEDTWPEVMARGLSEVLGREVEAYNFGVSGYGTDQEWLILREKVWQFAPDVVILGFSLNDVGETYKNKLVRVDQGELEVVSAKERAGGNFWGRALRQTYTYHLVIRAASRGGTTKKIVEWGRVKILGFAPEERFFLSDAQLVGGPFEVVASQKNPPPEVLAAWQLVRLLLVDMKKQTQAHGAQLAIVVNIPRTQVVAAQWEQHRSQYQLDPKTSSAYEINEVLGQIANDEGIDLYDGRVDALDWYQETGEMYFVKDSHFNKNGNLFLGTKAAQFLVEQGLVE